MYLKQNNHKGIVSRDTFYAVKAEFARRNAGRAPSQKLAPSGRSCYSTNYALTERLVCGECGTLYRRCVWTKRGEKFAAWRCTSRVDNGTKYCHYSPTLRENSLQAAILAAVNDAMSQREVLVDRIAGAMRVKLVSLPGECLNLSDIERQLDGLNQEFQALFKQTSGANYMSRAEDFKRISDEMSALKEKRALLLERQNSDFPEITEWDESMTVKFLSANRIRVYLRGGIESKQILKDIW